MIRMGYSMGSALRRLSRLKMESPNPDVDRMYRARSRMALPASSVAIAAGFLVEAAGFNGWGSFAHLEWWEYTLPAAVAFAAGIFVIARTIAFAQRAALQTQRR